MRLLAIDPGEKHIGVAVSDPSGIIARPLTTLTHESRARDAEQLVALAQAQAVEGIVLGIALNTNGESGPQARRAERLAEALRTLTDLPIIFHDESYSSAAAQTLMLASGKKRRERREQIHAVAAAALLQSYLDANPVPPTPSPS
jgi:putative Holliday junction resolvase